MKFDDLEIILPKNCITHDEIICEKLIYLSTFNKSIALNLNQFMSVYKAAHYIRYRFVPCVSDSLLMAGYYGNICGMKIYTNKAIGDNEYLSEEEWEKLKILV